MGYFISVSSHMNHTLVLGQMVLSSIFEMLSEQDKDKASKQPSRLFPFPNVINLDNV